MASTPAAARNSFRKYRTSFSFGAAVLFFFLPFVAVRCNGVPLAEWKGTELATGYETVEEGSFRAQPSVNGGGNQDMVNTKQDRNYFALAALVLGWAGLLVSFSNTPYRPRTCFVAAGGAVLCLLLFWIGIKREASRLNSYTLLGAPAREVAAELKPPYFLCLLLFGAAAYFSWEEGKRTRMSRRGPDKAAFSSGQA